ncbi:MAG: hypothetical protein LBV41_09815 [Cytophagaceae bacterium]|jgi:hypothetical protein|nr:hypothetical protein [Cytophagaceae bacterium]
MSYRRSFNKQIGVHYSGTVSYSYPASQNGGSGTVTYSGTAYEDVQVNIDVETTPFDNSVAHCNKSVNVLTGAVVATEAAQIASIDHNAKKIGSTIVEGFFKTIRSEISQQIAELSSKLDSHLAHLHSMAKRCVEKQKQMESDYNDISNRYLKIFSDLNSELSNRIYELDKPTFVFKKQSDSQHKRTSENDLVSTVAVFGAESGDLQARISASIAKKRALDTIGKANTFLLKQKRLNNTINQSMLKESVAAVLYSPVCFIETQNEKSQIGKNVYQSDYLPQMQASELISDFQEKNWNNFSKENSSQIGRYFNAEVNSRYSGADTHTSRVRENIVKMLNFNQIKSV